MARGIIVARGRLPGSARYRYFMAFVTVDHSTGSGFRMVGSPSRTVGTRLIKVQLRTASSEGFSSSAIDLWRPSPPGGYLPTV